MRDCEERGCHPSPPPARPRLQMSKERPTPDRRRPPPLPAPPPQAKYRKTTIIASLRGRVGGAVPDVQPSNQKNESSNTTRISHFKQTQTITKPPSAATAKRASDQAREQAKTMKPTLPRPRLAGRLIIAIDIVSPSAEYTVPARGATAAAAAAAAATAHYKTPRALPQYGR